MAGVHEALVDGVVAAIDAAVLSQSFTPSKKLVPIFERDQLNGWAVSVYAGPVQREKQDRSGVYLKTYSVGVVVRTTADGSDSENETKTGQFLQLCEEICNALQSIKITGLPLVEIEQEAPFDMGRVSDNGLLMAQITLRYKGF